MRSKKLGLAYVALLLMMGLLLVLPVGVSAADSSAEAGFGQEFCTVQFDSMGGTPVAPMVNIPYGTCIGAPAPPTKSGYVFEGWYRSPAYDYRWDFATSGVVQDTILYANWTQEIKPPPVSSSSSTPVSSSSSTPVSSSSSTPVSSSSSTPAPSSSSVPAPSSSSVPAPSSSSDAPAGPPAPATPASSTSASRSRTSSRSRTITSSSSVRSVVSSSAPSSSSVAPESISTAVPPLTEVKIETPWSLISLLSTISGLVLGVVSLVFYIKKMRKRPVAKRETGFFLAEIVTSIVSLVVLLLVYNFSHPMILFDSWTVLMLIILAIEVSCAVLSHKNKDSGNNSDKENANTSNDVKKTQESGKGKDKKKNR